MASVEVAQHTMTFLGVLNEALQLVYGLRSATFCSPECERVVRCLRGHW